MSENRARACLRRIKSYAIFKDLKCDKQQNIIKAPCIYVIHYQALIAHLNFADRARGFRLHSSAEGRIGFFDISA